MKKIIGGGGLKLCAFHPPPPPCTFKWNSPDLTTERSFDPEATWVIDVSGLFFDMLFMGVRINRQ